MVLEEIKARIDIADLISSYGIEVKIAGASKKACCPFHNEKTPSFVINDTKGFYHCFGCGESGDAIKFVEKMDGLTFIEAVKKLAERCGVTIEEKEDKAAGKRKRLYALMAELAEFYHRCLNQIKEASLAREYLKSRDISEAVQRDFTIGYAPVGMTIMKKWADTHGFTLAEMEAAGVIKAPQDEHDLGYHRFGGRLMFTIKDKRGRAVAFSGRQLVENKRSGKYVNSPETLIFKKSNVLFGFDKAAGNIAKSAHHEAIICEGQIDTIRLHTCGFPVAVASQGTAFTAEHVAMIKKVADQVVLVFDDDAAGHKATIRTARLFLAAEMTVRTISLPGGDDPDSFLRKHRPEDFQALIDGAESIIAFQVRAERGKEAKPDTLDAMARVSKAVLMTIACAKNAVLKAGMIGEAAKLLGLPSAALNEELTKVKVEASKAIADAIEDEVYDDFGDDKKDVTNKDADNEIAGMDAGEVLPPSKLEIEFCGMLMENEHNQELDSLIGEFLPSSVFLHAFTRSFVERWRTEVSEGGDLFAGWRGALKPFERKWFDEVLSPECSHADGERNPLQLMREYIPKLWRARLERLQGELPAMGTAKQVALRFDLSVKRKQLQGLKWNSIKDIIRDLIKGEYEKWI